MRSITFYFRHLDWILITASLLLIAIGLLSLYSSSMGDFLNFKKQIIFSAVGLLFMFLLSFFDYRILRNDPYLIFILYVLCCLGLAGLFFFAPETRGVKGWYKLGPVSLGPIEFTKLIVIILLAKYFSRYHVEVYRIKHILFSSLYILVPSVLIFLQPDLGSVLILIALWATVLLISGIKLKHFFFLCLCFLLILIISWSFFLKDYQKERIINFVAPQLEPLGAGWSQSQSSIAIGSGGFFGKGFGQGSQAQYGFLPEPQTDFIFSAIAEEFGLFGVAVLFFLFTILIWRIVKIATFSEMNFPRLFASGFALLLAIQTFINIGMNLGLLPIIGIPLPLVSYGGSSLIAIFIGLGILQNIKISQG